MGLDTFVVAMSQFLSTWHAWLLVLPGTVLSLGILLTGARIGLVGGLHVLGWAGLVVLTLLFSVYEPTPGGGIGLRSPPLVAITIVLFIPLLRRVGAAVAGAATFLSALTVDLVMNWSHLHRGVITAENVMSSIGAGGWLERLWLDPLVVVIAALALGAARPQPMEWSRT
ncbi:MAG: hypothetical protein KA711_03425 [Ideonella sp. WA131b]|jgi:hypothetical protein|nr:hypothetical protein [Ideonella sp. WA131b]